MIDVFLEAAEELGYKVGDINGDLEDEGFTRTQVTLRDGSRTGTFRAFAEKHVGAGLAVLTHAHVNKVIMQDKKAVGVEVSESHRLLQYLLVGSAWQAKAIIQIIHTALSKEKRFTKHRSVFISFLIPASTDRVSDLSS